MREVESYVHGFVDERDVVTRAVRDHHVTYLDRPLELC